MQRRCPPPSHTRWTTAAAVVATVLLVAALRNDFYQLTSPSSLTWHVALRKAYSLVGFGTLAYLVRRALVERGFRRVAPATIVALTLYSGAIEVGQYVLGSTEGLGWNAVDIACGALGGVFGTADMLIAGGAQGGRQGEPPAA